MDAAGSKTLAHILADVASRHAGKEFLRYHDGRTWASLTYGDFLARVERLAAALTRLGLLRGDRIAILSENRYEWALTDYAAMDVGLITVPLYPTLPANQIAYIVRDSEARAIVVSTAAQMDKVAELRPMCPTLQHVLTMESSAVEADPAAVLLAEQEDAAASDDVALAEVAARRDALTPDDVLTLIYTSGTTGRPKGVILTHRNLVANVEAGMAVLRVTDDDLFLSFLPLCHIFERMAGHYLPMMASATIAYSRGFRHLVGELGEVRPTVMACVPRFYETLQERILKNVESAPALRQRVFRWAIAVGMERSRALREKRSVGAVLSAQCALADKLVYRKLQATVGGRLRFFVSGGAPLAASTAEFFHAVGILILEGYGLTETSPVISVNREDDFRFGTVGPVIPGVEVRIADDGEILTRGPHVMQGYYKLPDETRETIAPDGWLHTGDLGELDADGFLRITGRKKNLIKLSNGKYVAPEPVENALKASAFIAESVVFGDARKVAGALVVPAFSALDEWAEHEGIATEPRAELVRHPQVRKLYRQEVDRLTQDLADFEKVRVLLLLDRELTIEAGELTPTLKVKRNDVLATFDKEIEALYGGVE
jgi:long-chain acyl-CoA synthetase